MVQKKAHKPVKGRSPAPEKTARTYREQHAKIPGKAYTFQRRSTQQTARGLVHKTNYAPLGRPPSDHQAFGKYYAAYKVPTQYAGKKSGVRVGEQTAAKPKKHRTARKRR